MKDVLKADTRAHYLVLLLFAHSRMNVGAMQMETNLWTHINHPQNTKLGNPFSIIFLHNTYTLSHYISPTT
jgi:hypothetical protein